MDVIVCVKRVPDTETRIRIGEDGRSVDPGGVKFIPSPYDEYAIEAALRTKEALVMSGRLFMDAGAAVG